MKREDDTIQFENRDELREVLTALESVPESKRNEAFNELLKHLNWMDMTW